ncbi:MULTISPECIES: glycosyltransferase [Methylobacterium]|uniref:D-inositol-3-phosphate glycosyltransferase n=1 Tax=Methylobacterium jeotgali TaxID=381630 RepID=A0ABQ4SU28_9HYPH|nr:MULTISPECIES: glycosyltransferase [Methylobacterium]PIU07129.1 MAG: glycosyl transferase [Methylobacterium sp. CG09_land_8_20_14_0_10_71_15]PIU11453.1 MAG: glycosyl transferase [Methylobacterium sp. CG08_land_8_20_14_0_20_71_15]GJE05953.1 D-inositol-3-phosphate glycosyltransferase [Methylobacterium jeotgali]
MNGGFPSEPGPLAGARILQIIPELDAGGAERTTVDIAAALAAAGAKPLVASEGGRLVGELQAKGGVWLPFPAASKNPLAMAVNVARLVRLCRREGVQIIHARSRAPAWVALAAARRLRVPFVTTYHGSYSGRTGVKVLYNSVMARGDVVIANSHYTAALIRSFHAEQAGDRVQVIHRGTDLSAFSPNAVAPGRVEALRRAWGVQPHERVVLLAARLTAWKGQRVLIEAAARMRDAGVADFCVVLAGDAQGRTSYERELDNLVAARGLEGIVRRVGHCTDMPAAFRAASVVAVPSVEPEAFGRAAVEAQALGAPVVVSDLGAVPETVLSPPAVPASQRTGWRVPAGDPVALAEALEEALAMGASARDGLARRSREHVAAHFSLERMTADTLDVYARLLAGSGALPGGA